MTFTMLASRNLLLIKIITVFIIVYTRHVQHLSHRCCSLTKHVAIINLPVCCWKIGIIVILRLKVFIYMLKHTWWGCSNTTFVECLFISLHLHIFLATCTKIGGVAQIRFCVCRADCTVLFWYSNWRETVLVFPPAKPTYYQKWK